MRKRISSGQPTDERGIGRRGYREVRRTLPAGLAHAYSSSTARGHRRWLSYEIIGRYVGQRDLDPYPLTHSTQRIAPPLTVAVYLTPL